jgi:hypothetical protein
VLYVARDDEPERHQGVIVRVESSRFAPSDRLVEDFSNGVVDGVGFTRRYIWELRQLWHRERQVFLEVIHLATGGTNCTVVDGYGDAPYAPRRTLATALKQIAKTQRDEARRRARPAASRSAAASASGTTTG